MRQISVKLVWTEDSVVDCTNGYLDDGYEVGFNADSGVALAND